MTLRCGILVVCLAVSVPALAQTKEQPRLGVGLSMIPSSNDFGLGFGAGVLLPIKDSKAGSIGVLGAGGFQHTAHFNTDEFGGGARLTHGLTPKARVFLQGTISVVQRRDHKADDPFAHTRTDPAYSGGAGVSLSATERLNVVIEGDLGMLNEKTHNTKVGLLFFGVSLPIGHRT